MSTITTEAEAPRPSWQTDSLEGHAGNALQIQVSLETGMFNHPLCPGCSHLRHKAEQRLKLCLSDLAARMDEQGFKVFETARVRAVRTASGAAVMERNA